jgi:hypothetical protein
MATSPPNAASPRPGENLDYQPVAPMAVFAILLASLLTILVISLVGVGLYIRKPVIVWELLLLAGLGLFLSVFARIQIRNSEGTRTGLRLATTAWWMCVLGGAGYGAYVLAMEQAIRSQSVEVSRKWFDELSKPDQNVAFLQTIEPARRGRINPADEEQLKAEFSTGALAMFRSNELVRLFQRSGKDCRAEFIGIKDWKPNKTGYEVAQQWKVISPEGTFQITVYLMAFENKETATRDWVVVNPSEQSISLSRRTTYGRLHMELISEAGSVARKWQESVLGSQRDIAVSLCLSPADRERSERQRMARLFVSGGLGSTIQPVLVPPQFYGEFFRGIGGKKILSDDRLQNFLSIWNKGMIFPAGMMARSPTGESTPTLSVKPESIRYTVGVDMTLPGTRNAFARGTLVLVSENPEFVLAMNEARQKGIANPETADERPTLLLPELPERRWRIVSLESDLEPLQLPSMEAPR